MPTAQVMPSLASLSLEFIVIGGGLAGLSAAYTLAKAGHKVRLLEKQPALGVPAAGVRVPPNMSKLFKKWVGEKELNKTAVLNVATPWYELHTGEQMGATPWRPDVMAETGGDFLVMKHEDAHRLVHRIATAAGAKLRYGATVVKVTPGDPRPSVTLSTGEVLTADIVVGADGPRSFVRRTVFDYEDDAKPSGTTVFGGVIPASVMMKDPELSQLVKAPEWPMWMGENSSICAHPVRAYSEFAVQLHWPDEQVNTPDHTVDSWYEIVPTSTISTLNVGDNARRLMNMIPRLYRTRWMRRSQPVTEWVDDSGRIVLMGEAAHPWFPSGTHESAMCVEDAVVFGTLFGHLSTWDQVPTFLNAYEEIRQERTKVVNEIDISNAAFLRMPAGPERDARNAACRLQKRDWDDGSLKSEFENLQSLFGYDAEDAAEEWWVTWGRYTSTGRGYSGTSQAQYEAQSTTQYTSPAEASQPTRIQC